MISGANENELEIANARADILLMCGSETLKVIDKYYEQQLEAYENMRKEALDYLQYFNCDEICENITGIAKKLENILNKVGGDNE